MKRLALLLFLASSLRAQTITQQPTNQSVTVGQTATFTLTVSAGPCRSFWYVNGVGNYGPTASTITHSIPNVTLAMNGAKVQAQIFGCTGGGAGLYSNTVILTVTPAITLNSLAMPTSELIGIGQTDVLTVTGTYSDGSTKNLSSAMTWTSSAPTVASVAGGTVLGLATGSATITASISGFTATTSLTVLPVLGISFSVTNEDGTNPPVILNISQIATNPDGTTTSTPVMTLPDANGDTSLPLLYSSTLLYQASFSNNNVAVGQPLIFSPTLMLLVMPQIKSMSFTVVMCVATCTAGAVKSMQWGAE